MSIPSDRPPTPSDLASTIPSAYLFIYFPCSTANMLLIDPSLSFLTPQFHASFLTTASDRLHLLATAYTPTHRYFIPHLHLTVLSTSAASLLPTLILASRAAFTDLRVPKTKRIGWEAATTTSTTSDERETDLSGIKAAVRAGKGKGKTAVRGGEDWDLDPGDSGDGAAYIGDREGLPVVVTLNLVRQAFRRPGWVDC